MKIAVLGAGAIGGLVAGYLKLKGLDVSLTGHSPSVKAIGERGLKISGVRGSSNIKLDISEKLDYRPELAIVSTKTQDIDTAIKENLNFIRDSTVLTTQNGIQADDIAAKYIPKENIISSIVMFGATYLEPGNVLHNFEGSWIIGRLFNPSQKSPGFSPRDECTLFSAREGASAFRPRGSTVSVLTVSSLLPNL